MKQERNIATKAKSQNRQGIKDAFSGNLEINLQSGRLSAYWRRQGGGREGPPGCVLNPGKEQCLFPDHPPEAQAGYGSMYSNEFQYFNKKTKNKFLSQLNFTIMKKQILILALFVMAIFATSTAFGQGAVKYTDPRALTCPNDALHPIAGKKYTYAATGTGTGTYQFWATKNANFITSTGTAPSLVTTLNTATGLTTASKDLLITSANYNSANAQATVDITWSSKVLNGTSYQGTVAPGTPTFVAAYFKDGGTGCADNFKVWELDPKNGFTVDVLSLNPATPSTTPTYTDHPAQCPDIVRNATYTAGTGIHYDYGVNYLYFEFVAANFSDYWIPTFDLNASLGTSQTATYEYTYALPATWTAATTWTTLVSGTTHIPVDASVTDTEKGVSVFVRVTIANKQWENLAGQTLTMVLDGQNAEGLWDVDNSDCGLPATKLADQNDKALQDIKARPGISATTSSAIPANINIITGDNK